MSKREGKEEKLMVDSFNRSSLHPTLKQRIAWRTWRKVGCPGLMQSNLLIAAPSSSTLFPLLCEGMGRNKKKEKQNKPLNKRKRIRKRLKRIVSCSLFFNCLWCWDAPGLISLFPHPPLILRSCASIFRAL